MTHYRNEPQIFKSKNPTLDRSELDVSLGHHIIHSLEKWENTQLFIDCETGRRWTGAQMSQQVRVITAALVLDYGMRPGDIACISYDFVVDTISLAFAILCAGGIVSCVNIRDPYYSLLYLAKKTRPNFLFSTSDRSSWADKLQEDMSDAYSDLKLRFIAMNGEHFEHQLCYRSLDSFDQNSFPVAPHAPIEEMLAFMTMSSGTTGMPKVIAVTHRNTMLWSLSQAEKDRQKQGTNVDNYLGKQVTLACTTTLDYVSGRLSILGGITHGQLLVVMNGFQVDKFIDCVPKYQINSAYIGAQSFHVLIVECMKRQADLRPLKLLSPVGAHLPSLQVSRDFFEHYKHIEYCVQFYGTSETGTIASTELQSVEKLLADTTCCGQLNSGLELKVIEYNQDDPLAPISANQRLLGPGEHGLMLVRGPGVFPGYYDSDAVPEKPHLIRTLGRVFDADNFYITGDMGYVHPETGHVHMELRLNESMHCRSNKKVLPRELEQILAKHEAVSAVVVLGIESQREPGVDCPRAFVMTKETIDKKQWKELAPKLLSFVNDQVAWVKHLTGGICLLEHIPTLQPSGKANKRYLRSLKVSNAFIYGSQCEIDT